MGQDLKGHYDVAAFAISIAFLQPGLDRALSNCLRNKDGRMLRFKVLKGDDD